MAIKQTIDTLKGLLENVLRDLGKADRGNKAASQRVRTGTIRLEKVAKMYRKESIKFDKQNVGKKKPAKKAAKKAAPKKAAKKATHKTKAKSKAMSMRKKGAKRTSMRAR